MIILTEPSISSWEEDRPFAEPSSIATETEPAEHPAWERCIDALLQFLIQSQTPTHGCEPLPNPETIKAAISWVAFLRKRFPDAPPTCIIREPGGGIIVERRIQLPNGIDSLCELTFYNDSSAERTDYRNGKIQQMIPIPQKPQKVAQL